MSAFDKWTIRIAAQELRIAKVDQQIGQLMSKRVDLENKLGELLAKRAAARKG